MAELRQIQLDILDKIHGFCIERGLRYSLGGGTLLGAVRHKGYIPWDDDIDIMMPRPDYDRFLKEFDGVCPRYVVQHYKNDKNCPLPFAKVYDDRTVLIDSYMKTGVFVDVFPIEGLPDKQNIDSYIRKMDRLRRNVNHTTIREYSPFLHRLIKRLFYKIRSKCIEKFDLYMHSYDFENSFYAGVITGRYREKEYMKSEVFKKYIDIIFEGRVYKAIADYDLYLKQHYGNYMELPPIEKQKRDHDFESYWK